MWPLELRFGTLNPRFGAWPLELGLGTRNPRFVVWPLELGLGTRSPRFVALPLELGFGTLNPRHPLDHLDPVEGLEASIEEDPEALESWMWGIKQ